MATYAAEFFKQKLTKKHLVIELEENENILMSIKQAMKTHSIKEASIDLMEGSIKSGKMSTLNGSNLKLIELNNSRIENASGHFKLSFDELFGSMHILAKTPKPETGTLQKGTACNGLKIRMGFYTEQKN